MVGSSSNATRKSKSLRRGSKHPSAAEPNRSSSRTWKRRHTAAITSGPEVDKMVGRGGMHDSSIEGRLVPKPRPVGENAREADNSARLRVRAIQKMGGTMRIPILITAWVGLVCGASVAQAANSPTAEAIFQGACATCHAAGSPRVIAGQPLLPNTRTITGDNPIGAIGIIMRGKFPPPEQRGPWMPSLAATLNDWNRTARPAMPRCGHGCSRICAAAGRICGFFVRFAEPRR